jgi:hypothetical protein
MVLSEGQLHRVAAVKPKEAAKTEPFWQMSLKEALSVASKT